MFEKKYYIKDLYVAKVRRVLNVKGYIDGKLYFQAPHEAYIIVTKESNKNKVKWCSMNDNFPLLSLSNIEQGKIGVRERELIPLKEFLKDYFVHHNIDVENEKMSVKKIGKFEDVLNSILKHKKENKVKTNNQYQTYEENEK